MFDLRLNELMTESQPTIASIQMLFPELGDAEQLQMLQNALAHWFDEEARCYRVLGSTGPCISRPVDSPSASCGPVLGPGPSPSRIKRGRFSRFPHPGSPPAGSAGAAGARPIPRSAIVRSSSRFECLACAQLPVPRGRTDTAVTHERILPITLNLG